MVGIQRMMSPTKPVTIPAEPNLVGIFLKNINTNIATQIGIVELTRVGLLQRTNIESQC